MIRFSCTACRKTMKLAEAISEPKKVRCSGCGIIILLTPDPNDRTKITTTCHQKPEGFIPPPPSSQQKYVLFGVLGAIVLFLVFAYWYNLPSVPPERAAVEGEVTLDDVSLESGSIVFTFKDDKKEIIARSKIDKGRYTIGASNGPGIGSNKVEITGGENDTIAPQFKEQTVDIQAGSNTKKFELKSK